MPLTLAADMQSGTAALANSLLSPPSVFRMPVITSTQHKTSAPAGPANVGGYRIAAAVQAFGLVLLALLGMTGALPPWALLCGFGLLCWPAGRCSGAQPMLWRLLAAILA